MSTFMKRKQQADLRRKLKQDLHAKLVGDQPVRCEPTLNGNGRIVSAASIEASAPAVLNSTSGAGMYFETSGGATILLKNTKDLSEEGLRALCRPYGTVISVRRNLRPVRRPVCIPDFNRRNYKCGRGERNCGKGSCRCGRGKCKCGQRQCATEVVRWYDCNDALVDFAHQREAGFAIQELNQKLGFQFYAAFVNEDEKISILEEARVAAPPPPFVPGPNEKLVPIVEVNTDEECWESKLASRKIMSGFSIPLKIKFPARQSLSTAPHYDRKSGKLSRIDADQIFNIVSLVESKHCGPKPVSDVTDRLKDLVQQSPVKRLTVEGEYNGQKVYGYSGLSEEQSRLFPDTRCIACGHLGFFSCSICEAPYCSKHCQEVDYQSHIELCHLKNWNVTPKNNKSKKGSIDYLAQEVFPLGAHVTILSVLSPDRVYLRSLEKESNKEYLRTLSDVAQTGTDAVGLDGTPEPGDICLAFYKPLRIYGRVLITKVTRKQVYCVFIEFGLVVLLNIEELKQLNNNDLKLRKVRVHKVHLKGITNENGHVEKAMSYLNGLIGQPLEIKVQLEGINLVGAQLRTAEGIIVNKKINHLIIIPIIKYIEDTTSYVDYKNVPHKKLAPNKELDIMILNRTTITVDFRVTLIACEDLPYLEDLERKLQSYGKKVETFTEHYTPRLNEVCLVRNMDTWYRAVLLESVGDRRPSVFLCDYGCVLMPKLENIRKIPPSFATEVRTTDAKIFGLEDAKKAGVKLDSEFLDIFLEENERITVQTSEESEFTEGALLKEEVSMVSVIKVPDFITFMEDRVTQGPAPTLCVAVRPSLQDWLESHPSKPVIV